MTTVVQFILAILICIVVPMLIGDLLIPNEALGKKMIMGILTTLAVSQVLFIPFIYYQHNYTPYFYAYILIIGGLCILSVFKRHNHYHETFRALLNVKENVGELNNWMILAILLIGVQVARVVIGHFFVYADNSMYIPIINDLIETDKEYYYDHIMGRPGAHETNIKYLFTTYFPYLSSISKLSGLHPAVLVQTVLPAYFTIITYNLVWHFGLFLFKDKRSSWMFVLFYGLLAETIGGYDHTQANSVVSGIYFGKKIVFLILIPFIMLYIAEHSALLEDKVEKLKAKDIFLLFVMVAGTCAPSLMGTGLAPIVVFLMGIVLSVKRKSVIPFFQLLIPIIPSIVYLSMVVCYLYFR